MPAPSRIRRRTPACILAVAAAAGCLAAPAGAHNAPGAHAPTARISPFTPNGPVGYDAFRRLDLLPVLRPGAQARQASSYDRRGYNDDGVTGAFSCRRETPSGECVIAEHTGPGQIDSMWFTRDRGNVTATGTLRIDLDGRTVVQAPLQSVVDGRLGPPFQLPLVANAAQSSGGVYIKVPMPFRERMLVTTSANPRYHHVAFREFASADGVATFDRGASAADVLSTLRSAGLRDPKRPAPGAATAARTFSLAPGRRIVLARRTGPGIITALALRFRRLTRAGRALPAPREDLFRYARIQMFFDGRRTVDAPLGELFGSGVAPATVRSLLLAQSPSPLGWLSSWFPMPYAEGASIHLVNASRAAVLAADLRLTSAPSDDWGHAVTSGDAGRFHATSHRGFTAAGRDWPLLAVTGRPGLLVGLTESLRGPRTRRYLEGDERLSADGSSVSLYHGTGTEDFFEGGFYFIRGPFTRPLNGAPSHRVGGRICPLSDCTGMYRLLLADAVPWTTSLRFSMEHGNRNLLRGFYSSTAYWYG